MIRLVGSHNLLIGKGCSKIRVGIAHNFLRTQMRGLMTSQDATDYNKFHAGITLCPHPDKKDKGGEDAAAVSETFIALADGVGGWSDNGVDPAKYSRELCGNIASLLAHEDRGIKFMCNPKQLCIEAAKMQKETGSSTCIIASLDREAPVLYTSNLGDSGYLLLRKT